MKECPQCRAKYFDNMLEYCLDDGTKLIYSTETNSAPTQPNAMSPKLSPTAEKTFEFFPSADIRSSETETIQVETSSIADKPNTQKDKIRASVISKSLIILENTPIIVALAHNYWQWLYLSKLYYSGLTAYFLSPVFLVWICLLIFGISLSIGALNYGASKKFAVTALVVLAINVLLYIVPK